MGSNKSGIIHNQTDQEVYYTLHSVDKVPQALVTKMSFGLKAGANTNQGINAGGKGEYTKELKQKFAAKEGICVLQPGRIGQTGLKKLDLDSIRHFSLVSQSRDILTNMKINQINDLCFVIKREDFSIQYLSADKTKKMKALMKSQEVQGGLCSKCSRRANQYQFQNKFTCKICKDDVLQGWACQIFPLLHLICNVCHDEDNHREPQQQQQYETPQMLYQNDYDYEQEEGEGEAQQEGEFEDDQDEQQQ